MNEYDLGASVTLSGTFKVEDTLTDPTTIVLSVTDPSGDALSYQYSLAEVTRTSTGLYTKTIVCSEVGEWVYTWTGTGAVAAVGTKRFAIRRADA